MVAARWAVTLTAILFFATGLFAQAPTLTTITGSPLRINVGSDGSFQVFNAAVPGFGQIFPTQATLADMGVFARVDGELYAPNFAAHTGGSATSALTDYTPWTPLGISRQSGNGSPEEPFSVDVALGAGTTGVRLNVNVTYVSGANFFRIRKNFFRVNDQEHTVDALLGADIYLASSDNGVFVSEPRLAAVGGRTCDTAEGFYNILLIPITRAHRFTTAFYSEVWRQINDDELKNDTAPIGCVDNGAAIQWLDIMAGVPSVEISSAVSFGEIPDPSNFFGFSLRSDPEVVALAPGESAHVDISSRHNAELGFNSPIELRASNLPQGMHVTFDHDVIAAPGTGHATATVTVDGTIFPRTYTVDVIGSGGRESRGTSFLVEILCTPPMILSINQPGVVSVRRGERATLTIKPEGGGAHSYQWYAGHAPLTGTPIAGATSATLVTEPVQAMQEYWVRVTNACGSADSLTALVIPTTSAANKAQVQSN